MHQDQFGRSKLSWAAGLFVFVSIFLLLLRGAHQTPFWDEFYFHDLYDDADQGRINLGDLLKPHNGHNYLFLKLWLWILVYTGIDWRLSMYLQAFLLAMAAIFIVNYMIKSQTFIPQFVLSLTIAMLVGSARQVENLYWGMQVSVALMLLASVVAFSFIARLAETHQWKYAVFAIATSLIALGSFGSGFVTLTLTILSIVLISKNLYIRASILALGGISVLCVILLGQKHNPNEIGFLSDPIHYAKYSLAFFSNALFSFSSKGDDTASLVLGVLIIALSLYCIRLGWTQRSHHIFACLMIAFSLLTCFAITLTRLKLGVWQPNASRYYPFAAFLLIGDLIILATSPGKTNKILGSLLSGSVFLSFAYNYLIEWRTAPYRYRYLAHAHANLCRGSDDNIAFYGNKNHVDINVIRRLFCDNDNPLKIVQLSTPILLEYGPKRVMRSAAFNPQPDGASAMWFRVRNCESPCTLVFSGHEIPLTVNQDPSLLTAKIPENLYNRPGPKPFYIKSIETGHQSSPATFRVD